MAEQWKRIMDAAGIPPLYQPAKLETNCQAYAGTPRKAAALRIVTQYVASSGRLRYDDRDRCGLYLCGTFGVGKTWLATAAFKSLLYGLATNNPGEDTIRMNHRTIWSKAYRLFREVQSCYNPAATSTVDGVLGRYQRAALLLLDDVGDLTTDEDTADRRRLLYEVLDYRNDHALPTILTTNLMPDELAAQYTDRTGERVKEMCAIVAMGGDNMRETAMPA